eukprot:SAG31_NODE_575_length_13961_cov_41.577550_8_plen_128_part_00
MPGSPGGGGRVVGAVDAATVQILSALARLDERLTRSEEAAAARFVALDQPNPGWIKHGAPRLWRPFRVGCWAQVEHRDAGATAVDSRRRQQLTTATTVRLEERQLDSSLTSSSLCVPWVSYFTCQEI